MMLDYGQISRGRHVRIGWFAQVEVFFCVPVEWYKVVNGKWVFHDWAVITPFIYVDDDISVPTGRTVYGFPKALARVTPSASKWITDPVAPVTLARVETAVFPELYQGRRLEFAVLPGGAARRTDVELPGAARHAQPHCALGCRIESRAGDGGLRPRRDVAGPGDADFSHQPRDQSAFVPEMLRPPRHRPSRRVARASS